MSAIDQQIRANKGFVVLREAKSDTAKLAFFGDLAFHDSVLESLWGISPHSVLDGVRADTLAADLVIGNLESILVRQPFSPLGGKACLVSDLKALSVLEAAGFDVLTIANNHILDAGPAGLAECLDGIAKSKMQATGAGLTPKDARIPASKKVGSLSFKIFAYCYDAGQIVGRNSPGCNEAILEKIQSDLAEHCESDDIPIVCLHMDAEFQSTPAPDRMALCRRLASCGVPLIICHHPHVIQGIEVYEGSLIAYSLGNYVFPILPYMKNNSDECHFTYYLEIEADKEGAVAFRINPAVIDKHGFPIPAKGQQREDILDMIADRSELLGDPEEINKRYFLMVKKYSLSLMKNIYWAIGEGDLEKANMIRKSLAISRTKRNWIRHFIKKRIVGRF